MIFSPNRTDPTVKGSDVKVCTGFVALILAGTLLACAEPLPGPSLQLTYGDAAPQAIDLFLPSGPGPYPVVILIHGGCWSSKIAGREQLRPLGRLLARQGIAVWSIGYRRADEPGGGYPGTFLDVAEAIDRLPLEAGRYHLDLGRTVLAGHSAGGHLALWAASRQALPATSPLHRDAPFVPPAVISLAGVGDLEAFAPHIPRLCGEGIREHLTMRPASGPGDVYAEISPARLVPGARILLISARLDTIVPPSAAALYAEEMHGKGKPVERVDIPQSGHLDLVAPGTAAWAEVSRRIGAALGLTPVQPAAAQ